MLKRFIRVLLNTIALPITILLYLVDMVGTLIDVVIAPIEYIITGKPSLTIGHSNVLLESHSIGSRVL